MTRALIYLKIIKHTILFYMKGCEIVPSRVLSIQQGFYHQLKGLLDKKILPFLYMLEKGEETYSNNLVGSIIEMHRTFEDEIDNILTSIPPNRKLNRLLMEERKLYKSAVARDLTSMAELLPQFRETAREVFIDDCRGLGFDLGNLLRDVIKSVTNDYRELIERSNTKVAWNIKANKAHVIIPFEEVSTWRDILRNLIINGIEACENSKEVNEVRIEYEGGSGSNSPAGITINDNGCGMSSETLANFFKRGYTSGKETGTGYGFIDEYIDFINRQGSFNIHSELDKGTAVNIEINPGRISKASRSYLHYKKRDRAVKLTLLFIMIMIFFFTVGGDDFLFPPSPIEDNFIARFSPEKPFGNDRIWEYGSVTIRTETNKARTLNFIPSAIKVAFEDSVGPVCYDIDMDDIDEMIAVILPPPEDRIDYAGDIRCYTPKGKLDWSVGIEKDFGINKDMSVRNIEKATISQMMVIDTRGNDNFEIYAIANFPDGITKLVLINSFGDVLQEYYHYGPAHIYEFAFGDGNIAINPIIAGRNIFMDNSAVITRVDYDSGIVQGPPYFNSGLKQAVGPYYVMGSLKKAGIYKDENRIPEMEPYFYNCFIIGKPQKLHVFQLTDGRLAITDHNLKIINLDFHLAKFEEWRNNLLPHHNITIEQYLDKTGKVYTWEDDEPRLVTTYNSNDSLTGLFRQCGIF